MAHIDQPLEYTWVFVRRVTVQTSSVNPVLITDNQKRTIDGMLCFANIVLTDMGRFQGFAWQSFIICWEIGDLRSLRGFGSKMDGKWLEIFE